MGQVIYFPERAVVARDRRVGRAYQERERAMVHARMMVVSALLTAALMMSALAALPFLR